MTTRPTLTFLSLVTAALHSTGHAQDAEPRERAVAFEIGTGLEYDSNVAVLELDTTTGASDATAMFELGVGYDLPSDGRFDFSAGYNFSETAHEDFDAFDLRIHRASAAVSYDLGRVDTGANFQYARAELDGDEFLTLTQVSPYVSKLVGERLFLRFAYAHTDKDFAGNPDRAAKAGSWSSDLYVFVNGLRTYLLFGYRHDSEDAVDEQFDYAGERLRAQLSRRIELASRDVTLKVGLRLEQRDYAHPTLSIGAPRADDRSQLEASADIPLTERTVLQVAYKHADNESNLPSVDFAEDVYSVTFTAEF